MIDRYQTIERPSEGLYKEKGSKFIGYAAPVTTADEAMRVVEQVRKDHPKARHHCYAWRIGADQTNYRFNDDGEPSGTGGKPILGQIDAFELSDIVVVVSRYFGGKLLGAAGLAAAYRQSARDALSGATVISKELSLAYRAEFAYEVMGTLMDALSRHQAKVVQQEFNERPYVIFNLPLSHDPYILDLIIAHALGIYPEEVTGRREFANLKIARV
jgi:uncharacterized YigZ family protein